MPSDPAACTGMPPPVFLNRLDDRRSAAAAFEAAGEFDRALGLYRELNEHVTAAELLRRIGEEDEAIRYFQIAAQELAQRPGGRLAAEEPDARPERGGRPGPGALLRGLEATPFARRLLRPAASPAQGRPRRLPRLSPEDA
ncbi:MAG: hypothetical protein U0800_01565 [Isosphaeraceae bacterium]